jgi:prophage regulatory protein
VERELVGALDLEKLTGTKASTWRYWASIGTGPASFKLGRRRVWRKSAVLAWLAEQELATAAGENA